MPGPQPRHLSGPNQAARHAIGCEHLGEARDPRIGVSEVLPDPRVREYLGDAYPRIARFAEMLAADGVTRGLIGPREVPRLWARHLLNSAAVASLLPADGTLVDVGSGAGLPGIVLACMRTGGDMVLLEPMERRATWLQEVVTELRLPSIEVVRARAEGMHGKLSATVVVARARSTSIEGSRSSVTTSCNQVARRSIGSSRTMSPPVRMQARTIPGRPAPLPTSTRVPSAGSREATAAEFNRCRAHNRGTSRGPIRPRVTPSAASISAKRAIRGYASPRYSRTRGLSLI